MRKTKRALRLVCFGPGVRGLNSRTTQARVQPDVAITTGHAEDIYTDFLDPDWRRAMTQRAFKLQIFLLLCCRHLTDIYHSDLKMSRQVEGWSFLAVNIGVDECAQDAVEHSPWALRLSTVFILHTLCSVIRLSKGVFPVQHGEWIISLSMWAKPHDKPQTILHTI